MYGTTINAYLPTITFFTFQLTLLGDYWMVNININRARVYYTVLKRKTVYSVGVE